jgi:hypothetical protein
LVYQCFQPKSQLPKRNQVAVTEETEEIVMVDVDFLETIEEVIEEILDQEMALEVKFK